MLASQASQAVQRMRSTRSRNAPFAQSRDVPLAVCRRREPPVAESGLSRFAYRVPLVLAYALLLGSCNDAGGYRSSVELSALRTTAGSIDADQGFAKAERSRQFAFPLDHGPHSAFRSEWWYLTAVVADAHGRQFGVQFTLFRQGLEPRGNEPANAWRSGQVFMGHAAVSDIHRRRHWQDERLARGHPALAGAMASPFRVHIEGWQLASVGDPFWPLRLELETRQFAVELTLTGTKPIVAQGEGGLSRKGPDNASHYYSIPRIDAAGAVTVDGESHAVAGSAWLDREWSTSVLAAEYAGWDWFALRLEDGRDLMLYQMRRVDGQPDHYNSGALVAADGSVRILSADDFSLAATERWQEWPVAWRLTLRDEPPITVRAAFEDQVMDTAVRYWEGVVYVDDRDGNRLGAGYMELTGYR